jgi:hypothetical protein
VSIPLGEFDVQSSADGLKLRDREQPEEPAALAYDWQHRKAYIAYRDALTRNWQLDVLRRSDKPLVLLAGWAQTALGKRVHKPMKISVIRHLGATLEDRVPPVKG